MRSDNAEVTRHASKRIRQRIGIPKDAVERNADKALRSGVPRTEYGGQLRRYLDALYHRYACTANNILTYNDHVYVFSGGILITVLHLPSKYLKAAQAQQKKRGQQDG